MTCNPLVIPTHPELGWQAWCKPCGWEGPERDHLWQARNDRDAHKGLELEPAPPWIRGPR